MSPDFDEEYSRFLKGFEKAKPKIKNRVEEFLKRNKSCRVIIYGFDIPPELSIVCWGINGIVDEMTVYNTTYLEKLDNMCWKQYDLLGCTDKYHGFLIDLLQLVGEVVKKHGYIRDLKTENKLKHPDWHICTKERSLTEEEYKKYFLF